MRPRTDSFPIGEVKLEGSKENFARCLTGLLGARYKRLITALDEEETVYRLGPEFDDIVETMGGSFANILSILHKVLPHTSKNE